MYYYITCQFCLLCKWLIFSVRAAEENRIVRVHRVLFWRHLYIYIRRGLFRHHYYRRSGASIVIRQIV